MKWNTFFFTSNPSFSFHSVFISAFEQYCIYFILVSGVEKLNSVSQLKGRCPFHLAFLFAAIWSSL